MHAKHHGIYRNLRLTRGSCVRSQANDGTNNDGGNTNWLFTPTVNITGTVYNDEGVTALGNQTVRIAVNGVDFGTTAESNGATGAYTVSGLTLSNGDVITAYLEDEVTDAVAVTVYDGTALSLDIYRDFLIARKEDGTALTTADLGTAVVFAEGDISNIYGVVGSTLTVQNTKELLIPTGHQLNTSGLLDTHDLNIDGTLDVGSNGVTISGSYDNDGTFTTSGLVTLTGAGNESFDTGGTGTGNDFQNLTINSGAGIVSLNTAGLDVDGTLTLGSGTFVHGLGLPITAGGYVQNGGSFIGGSGSIGVAGDFTLSAGTFTSTLGTLSVDGAWTHTAGGTFAHNNGTVAFTGVGNHTLNVNTSETFNNLTFAKTNTTLTVSSGDTLVALGTLSLSDGVVNGDDTALQAEGNVVILPVFDSGTAGLVFAGAANQTINATGGETASTGDIEISKSGGTVSLLSDLTMVAVGQSMTVTAGTLDVNGRALFANGGLAVQGGTVDVTNASSSVTADGITLSNGAINANGAGTIDSNSHLVISGGTLTAPNASGAFRVAENWTHTGGGSFTANGGTVEFDGSFATVIDAAGTEIFNGLTINKSGGAPLSIASGDTVTASGLVTFSDGTYTSTLSNGIQASGNVVVGAGWDGGNGLLGFAGASNQTFDLTGATGNFDGDIRVNKSASRVDLLSNLVADGAGQEIVIEEGTFDLNGNNLTASTAPVVEIGGNF